jgi:molybdate transport system ATP-binding protein
VQLRHGIGLLKIDVSFQLTHPWTILFGPSGSGKTTILRALAGLIRPNTGHILLREYNRQVVLLDTDSGVFVPAYRRRVKLAAQRDTLFPHMTVRENIAYGARGMASDGTRFNTFADTAIEQFRLKALAGVPPSNLSGGERRRVEIARAATSAMCARDKTLLLLDEPFSGLDAKLRDDLIADLRQTMAFFKIPVLSVTHDVAEAFQLGAEVIKLAEGRVVAQGPVEEVLAEERIRLLDQLGSEDGRSASTEPYLSG